MAAKHALLQAMWAVGAFAPFRLANRRDGVIVMYHRFSERASPFAVCREQFAGHLRYLTERYAIVTIPRMIAQLSARMPSAKPMAAITIDDGYSDSYDIAFPLLERFAVPATLFVVTEFLDGRSWLWTDRIRYVLSETRVTRASIELGSDILEVDLEHEGRASTAAMVAGRLKQVPDCEKNRAMECLARVLRVDPPLLPPPSYRPITWEQAREMDRHGVAIESHTVTHPILTNVADEQLQDEVNESRVRLEEELDRPATAFCYPNGNWNQKIRDAVERAGYSCAVSTTEGFNTPDTDPFALRRFGAEGDLARLAKTTSGFELWQVGLGRGAGRASVL